MKAIRDPLALSLCCILCFPTGFAQQSPENPPAPKPAQRPSYQSTELRGDERILHALNRFTFGPRPGDLQAIRSIGLDKWFDQQLHPTSIDESNLNARLAQFPEMQWSTEDLLYRLPSNGEIRQAMNTARVPIPESGTLHAIYENQIYRIQSRKDEKAQKNATAQPAAATPTTPQPKMQLASDGTMVPADPSGADTSPAAMRTANQPAAAAGQMDMSFDTADSQPGYDEASIRHVLALPPEQRVSRLAAMEPADFESFIKSLRPLQRVALNADLNPSSN